MNTLKFYFPFLLILAIFCELKSQDLPNAGFEDWNISPGDTVPKNWSTSTYGAGSSTDSYSGGYAAVVWNWYSYAEGIMVNGNTENMYNIIKAGTPISGKPTKLTGFYKYEDIMLDSDSAVVIVILKNYNTTLNKIDTVGYGKKLLGPANFYTSFQVDIKDMQPGVLPDSIVIAFYSSVDAFCSTDPNCSYLYIDDLTLDTQTGIINIDDIFETSRIYPNPAKRLLNIEYQAEKSSDKLLFKLMDISGNIVGVADNINDGRLVMNVSILSSGQYLLQIIENNQLIETRKIEVIH